MFFKDRIERERKGKELRSIKISNVLWNNISHIIAIEKGYIYIYILVSQNNSYTYTCISPIIVLQHNIEVLIILVQRNFNWIAKVKYVYTLILSTLEHFRFCCKSSNLILPNSPWILIVIWSSPDTSINSVELMLPLVLKILELVSVSLYQHDNTSVNVNSNPPLYRPQKKSLHGASMALSLI